MIQTIELKKTINKFTFYVNESFPKINNIEVILKSLKMKGQIEKYNLLINNKKIYAILLQTTFSKKSIENKIKNNKQ